MSDQPNAPTPTDAVHPHVARSAETAHKAIDDLLANRIDSSQFDSIMFTFRVTKESYDRTAETGYYQITKEDR